VAKQTRTALITLTCVTTFLAIDVGAAHHSLFAEFDVNRPVHLSGTVIGTAWVNPHVWIYLKVQDSDGGTMTWSITGDAPYALLTRGWRKDTLSPGGRLVVEGYAAKDGTTKACGHEATFPDGHTLVLGSCGPPSRMKGGATLQTKASSRVRYANERIAEVFEYAWQRSGTFRQLVTTMDASDVIVYIEEGQCQQGLVRACLQFLPATQGRYVVIRIDPRQALLLVVQQLAHELQHAAEIAGAADVVDDASVRRFYEHVGFGNCWSSMRECWETRQALAAERQVALETQTHTSGVDSAYFGEWVLNTARSTFDNLPAPRGSTRLHRDRGHGLISIVSDTVDPDGTHRRSAFVYQLDGQSYRMSASDEQPIRTIAATATDRFSAQFVVERDGAIVATGQRTLDKNGLTMTIVSEGVDDTGLAWASVEVWEKYGTGATDDRQ